MRALVLAAALVLGAAPAHAQSALADAARDGQTDAAIDLIRGGADVDERDGGGATALIWAAHRGDEELVRRLLRAGADPKAKTLLGATALAEAAATGDAPVIAALLKAGADPNETSREGQTALMAVARTGRLDAAQALLNAGADVNMAEGWGGQTALMWAASQGQPAMVQLLIEAGADLDTRGAVRDWQRRVTVEPRKKIMANGGFAALHYAARENCLECARHLIEAGADLNIPDPDRVSPLNLALYNRHFDVAALLIESGADVNFWDFAGRTPLYHAVDVNTPPFFADDPVDDELSAMDIVEMLLAAGADPNIQLKHRPEYRQGVTERGSDIMLSAGATPLLRASRAADLEAMRLLIDHGALVELPNQFGVTPFMVAAGVGFGVRATRGVGVPEARRIEAMEMLHAEGADINRRTLSQGRLAPPDQDNFLFRVQILQGNQRYILAYVPPDGRIALHGAAINGFTDAVRWLADHGSDIGVVGRDGLSAMDLAAGRYRAEYLAPPPEPFTETMELLEQLCAAEPGCSFDNPEAAEGASVGAAG